MEASLARHCKAMSDNKCRLLLRKRMLFRGAKGDDGGNFFVFQVLNLSCKSREDPEANFWSADVFEFFNWQEVSVEGNCSI